MLKTMEELENEKKVIENTMQLRRERHAEQMEEVKADYAEKISEKTGALVLTDRYIQELEENFEKGLSEEFDKPLEIIDIKMQIVNKEKEIEEQNKLIADKKAEIENAENEIDHEVITQYFSKEGLSEQPIDRSHVEEMKKELEELNKDLGKLDKENKDLYMYLEKLEPTDKSLKAEKQEVDEKDKKEEKQVDTNKENEEKVVEESKTEEKEASEAETEKVEEEENIQKTTKRTIKQPTKTVKTQEQNSVKTETVKTETAKPTETKTTSRRKKMPKLENVKISLTKNGSKLDIKREGEKVKEGENNLWYHDEPELTDPEIKKLNKFMKDNRELLNQANVGHKAVVQEIVLALLRNNLTEEETKQQISNYAGLVNGTIKNEEAKINLFYDLRGLVTAGVPQEERKIMIEKAKQAKDAGIAEVKTGFFLGAKWKIQDFTNKLGLKFWNSERAIEAPKNNNEKVDEKSTPEVQTEANVDKFGYRTTKTEAEVNAEKVSAQKESPTVEKEDTQNTL